MKLLALILLPYAAAWLITKDRRRAFRWLALLAIATAQAFGLLPLVVVGFAVASTPAPKEGVYISGIYKNFTVTQRAMHGLPGWEGVDIKAGCGAPIYAPFDGTVTYNGRDGYNHKGIYEQSTMLTIQNDTMELTLLHGDYHLPVGSPVKARDVIGKENTHGWSTGCHSHVILRQNGRTLNYLEWLATYHADYPLRVSWYDPSLCYDAGGNIIKNTNCDSDPTTMASGDKVASWLGGRGGVHAAACPRSDGWHHGKRFILDGMVYECRDTGGWINCYQPGMWDPALKRQAETAYCWVDLLNGSHYQYGSLAYNWGFIQ